MPHKFKIGDVVSYHPSDRMLSTARGTYTVAGHMPVQDGRQPLSDQTPQRRLRARRVGKRVVGGVNAVLLSRATRRDGDYAMTIFDEIIRRDGTSTRDGTRFLRIPANHLRLGRDGCPSLRPCVSAPGRSVAGLATDRR
jgi:hypothetical protein